MKSFIISCVILLVLLVSCTKTETCIDGYAHPKPADCSYYGYDPVCGCNDITYDNSCEAMDASVSTWTEGECF